MVPGVLAERSSVPLPEVATPDQKAGIRPGVQVGSYELIRELGRGGMGVVYLARDLKLGRRVAIKFMLYAEAELTKRFLVEARATARCHHENIVIIHEVDEFGGVPFMVLEYLEGKSLDELARKQPLRPERAVEFLVQVVRALHHAHDLGIIHRDLKPDNIFVTDAGVVKVLRLRRSKIQSSRAD